MTLQDLIALQTEQDLGDVHLAYLGECDFHLAHTDAERSDGSDLSECSAHRWLDAQDGPPATPGVYMVTPHQVDAYSEPYPVKLYDLVPLREACPDCEGRGHNYTGFPGDGPEWCATCGATGGLP